MQTYGMTMTLEDEMLLQKSREFTKELAKSMQDARDKVMWRIFHDEYAKWSDNMVQLVYIRRGRYEVWKGNKRLGKRIKHRKEALALIKLIRGNEQDDI